MPIDINIPITAKERVKTCTRWKFSVLSSPDVFVYHSKETSWGWDESVGRNISFLYCLSTERKACTSLLVCGVGVVHWFGLIQINFFFLGLFRHLNTELELLTAEKMSPNESCNVVRMPCPDSVSPPVHKAQHKKKMKKRKCISQHIRHLVSTWHVLYLNRSQSSSQYWLNLESNAWRLNLVTKRLY